MNPELKTQAIALRREGYLYSEIALKLGIAKSTAHSWTSKIDISQTTADAILARFTDSQISRIDNMAMVNRSHRLEREKELREKARSIVDNTSIATSHKMIICASLFWCEGTKDAAGGMRFTNSDPIMVRVFLKLLRESFDLDESKFRALVHLHEYHDPKKQQLFWSKLTQIPLKQFNNPYLKPHTGKRKRDEYPGCIRITYLNASFGKLLKMIYIEFSNIS